MSVLVIRAHKRYAVRRRAHLCGADGRRRDGLLIELSLQGCRLSRTAWTRYAVGETARVELPGGETVEGQVRWAQDGCVGLRFVRPLHAETLERLIRLCRDEGEAKPRTAIA